MNQIEDGDKQICMIKAKKGCIKENRIKKESRANNMLKHQKKLDWDGWH